MDKSTIFVGIDISKDTFDTFDSAFGHNRYSNDSKGFRLFFKTLTPDHHCVLEATGCYHQQLSLFLYERKKKVSVVNPLVIKRFIQMKLNRVKTDKSDANMICQYAMEQPLELWRPQPRYVEQCKELQTVIQLYLKQGTAIKNKLHALESRGQKRSTMITSLKRQFRSVKKEIGLLEDEMEALITANEADLYTRLRTIPGIGKKSAMLLMVSTNNFSDFESCKQISSYLGLAPNERSSGTSIRGKSRISKVGNATVRNHLFLCSFTACEYNPQCKALFERIVNKGKSKKLALIAVCNKLIKQAYGIAKSGLVYDPNYVSKLS